MGVYNGNAGLEAFLIDLLLRFFLFFFAFLIFRHITFTSFVGILELPSSRIIRNPY